MLCWSGVYDGGGVVFVLSPFFLIGWKKSLIDVNFIKLLTYTATVEAKRKAS